MTYRKILMKIRSITARWLISYILMLIIPLIMSSAVYFESNRILESEINRANREVVKKASLTIDNKIESIERMTSQIAWDARLQNLSYKTESTYSDYLFDTMLISKDLINYKSNYDFIDELYVYMINEDLGIFPGTSRRNELLYDLVFNTPGMDYNKWHNMMTGKHTMDTYPVKRIDNSGITHDAIAFISSIPVNSMEDPLVNMVVLVDTSKLFNSINDVQWIKDNQFILFGKNNEIISSSSRTKPDFTLDFIKPGESEGFTYKTVNGEKAAISYVCSNWCGWKYISVIPSSVFWEKSQYVRNMTLLSILISIILGCITALTLLKANYKPLRTMIQTVSDVAGISYVKQLNEYRFIQEAIYSTAMEMKSAKEHLKQQRNIVRTNFFNKLLKGKVENSIPIEDSLDALEIEFKGEYFAVAIFYFDDFTYFMNNIREKDYEKDFKLLQFIITNVVEELVNQNNKGYVFEIDDAMVCLINFSDEDKSDRYNELKRVSDETKKLLREKFKVILSASISDIHKSISGIPQAYKEALEVTEYRYVFEDASVVSYHDLPNEEQNITQVSYYYPLLIEQQVINSIKAGESEKANEILEDIIENNLNNKAMPLQTVKCLMFEVINTVIKTLNEMDEMREKGYFDRMYNLLTLVDTKSIKELKYEIEVTIEEICEHIKQRAQKDKMVYKEKQYKEFIDKVIKYINEYFSDSNLNITTISDYFNVSPTHLSKLFKQYTGDSMIDYLNRVRTKKAKELLNGEDVNIYEVSKDVGFNDVSTFIRTFKKYEGITPGKYKGIKI